MTVEPRPIPAIIFDLDGTLIDTAPDLANAANATLARFGKPPLVEGVIKSFIGHGIPNLVAQILEAADLAADLHNEALSLLEIYEAAPANYSKPYPGVEGVLRAALAKGYRLGVCTNKTKSLSLSILQSFGLLELFSTVIGGDSLPDKKPKPGPLLECVRNLDSDWAIFVGDSEVDAQTSQAAEIPFLLFERGYRKADIADIPHERSFSAYSDFFFHLDAIKKAFSD